MIINVFGARSTIILINLECMFFSWQIVFEGIAGKSYQGDIAIDDLKLIKSPCPYPGDYCFSFNLNELVDHPLSNVVSEKLRSTPSENKRLYSRL